jgi:hypothetical protein
MSHTHQEDDEARTAHNQESDAAKVHIAQIGSFSTDAMKAPALVAAGGVAAALGYFSANYVRLAEDPANIAVFNELLKWLFMSLLFTVIAPGAAYFSQMAYFEAIYAKKWHRTRPFVRDTTKSKSLNFVGNLFRWAAVSLVALSIGSLGYAGWTFLQIIK